MLGKSISKNSLILGSFALVTAAILAITYEMTYKKIAEAERLAAQKALLEIVPRERHTNEMLNDVWTISEEQLKTLNLADPSNIHIARNNGEPVAAIIPSIAPDGYSGDIKMIIGVNVDGSVAGVRVLAHKETPGLGDKIDLNKDDWILSFNGKTLPVEGEPTWAVKKDGGQFDQFTGATITPRAVVKQVETTLRYFQQHKSAIFTTTKNEPDTTQ